MDYKGNQRQKSDIGKGEKMAWTDSCKYEATAQIDHKKKKGLSLNKACRELSEEDGKISASTIKHWYLYPNGKKAVENSTGLNLVQPTFETCAISDLTNLVEAGKKFGTIYADPPWQYSNQATRASTDNHYVTMTATEIADLPIKALTAEQAHLHLWTTNAFLFECPAILEAWGFEYKGIFVWVKNQMGIGNYWRVSHEVMILGVRGGLRFSDKSQTSWIATDRTKHSVKPDCVVDRIEKVSPGPYLELFARRTRPNWTTWGNEIARNLFNENAFNQPVYPSKQS